MQIHSLSARGICLTTALTEGEARLSLDDARHEDESVRRATQVEQRRPRRGSWSSPMLLALLSVLAGRCRRCRSALQHPLQVHTGVPAKVGVLPGQPLAEWPHHGAPSAVLCWALAQIMPDLPVHCELLAVDARPRRPCASRLKVSMWAKLGNVPEGSLPRRRLRVKSARRRRSRPASGFAPGRAG